jgi:prepilin peptidase CpaA
MNVTDVRTIAVLLVALVAVFYDVRTGRIPNALTFGAAALALVYGAVSGGSSMLAGAALAWVIGALLFFPFFALGGMGAGDVKLLAALAAWLGPGDTLWLAMFASVAGGVLGAAVALGHGYLREALSNIWLMLMEWRVSGLRPVPGLTLRDTKAPRLAYAIPITIGVLCTLWRH